MAEKKLYVGNLSFKTTEEGLQEAFSRFGTVTRATVVTDRETGRARGFGFVEMSTDEEVQAAIAGLNGQSLDGRTIQVNVARPREDRGGGGDGGRRGYR
jgi:RNA recognition motif-containing protein